MVLKWFDLNLRSLFLGLDRGHTVAVYNREFFDLLLYGEENFAKNLCRKKDRKWVGKTKLQGIVFII